MAVQKNYNVDQTSPNGIYRVKISVSVEDVDSFGGFHEWGKVQFFKGGAVIDKREWDYADRWESTFISSYPAIEWIGENALRMGQERTDKRLLDELIIFNNTDEKLSYLSVTCGRYEEFKVFDLAPRSQIRLPANVEPWVKDDGTFQYSFVRSGTTQSGRKFSKVVEPQQTKDEQNHALQFTIDINPEDLFPHDER